MKVLVLASTFPASESDGIPGFVRDQVNALATAVPGLSLTVLAPHHGDGSTRDHVRHRNFDEYRFRYALPRRLQNLAGRGIEPTLRRQPLYYLLVPVFLVAETVYLWRMTRRLHPDVLYAHWFTPQGIAAGVVSAVTGVPYVWTSHSSDVAFLRKLPFLGPLTVRVFTRRASRVSVVSRRSLAKLRSFFDGDEWAALESRVAVIPMGVDLPEDTGVDAGTVAGGGGLPREVLFLGRLAEKKGVQYLLPAVRELATARPVHLTVAGDGPWRDRLRRQAADLGLGENHVTFVGYVTGDRKRALIDAADVYVVPSIITDGGDAEGLPVSLLEGLAAGRICVATRESGADDIVTDGRDAFLVTERDVPGLVTAMMGALDLSPDRRADMGRHARRVADGHGWHEIALRHHRFLLVGALGTEL